MRLKLSRRTFVALLALLVIALGGCQKGGKTGAAPSVPDVSATTVHTRAVPVSIELPGRTSPILTAQVRARVDGIVQKREFTEGTDVAKGQLLYQIEPVSYRVALDSAQAALEKAEANLASTSAQLDRSQVLIAGNAVSKQAYENAVTANRQAAADVGIARAAVKSARINYGYTRVTSPIAGRIGISQVTQGAYVQGSSATLLATVQQLDPIYVDLQQPNKESQRLRDDIQNGRTKLGSENPSAVSLFLENGSRYPLKGKLEVKGTTVDPSTSAVTLRAVVPNPDHVLLPGMFVHAQVEQGTNEKAILIPTGAVSHNPQGQATVAVVETDNKLAIRVVQTGSIIDGQWVIESGLHDGERVVVSGLQKAQPGMIVNVTPAKQPASISAQSSSADRSAVAFGSQ